MFKFLFSIPMLCSSILFASDSVNPFVDGFDSLSKAFSKCSIESPNTSSEVESNSFVETGKSFFAPSVSLINLATSTFPKDSYPGNAFSKMNSFITSKNEQHPFWSAAISTSGCLFAIKKFLPKSSPYLKWVALTGLAYTGVSDLFSEKNDVVEEKKTSFVNLVGITAADTAFIPFRFTKGAFVEGTEVRNSFDFVDLQIKEYKEQNCETKHSEIANALAVNWCLNGGFKTIKAIPLAYRLAILGIPLSVAYEIIKKVPPAEEFRAIQIKQLL